jgi:hypothetical protein
VPRDRARGPRPPYRRRSTLRYRRSRGPACSATSRRLERFSTWLEVLRSSPKLVTVDLHRPLLLDDRDDELLVERLWRLIVDHDNTNEPTVLEVELIADLVPRRTRTVVLRRSLAGYFGIDDLDEVTGHARRVYETREPHRTRTRYGVTGLQMGHFR